MGSWREECALRSPSCLWLFDRSTAGNITAEVSGKVLIQNGTPTFGVTGPFPGRTAVQFDNVGDWFEIADDPVFDVLTGTIIAVVRRDADSGAFEDLITKGAAGHVAGWTSADKWQIGKNGTSTLSSESGTSPAPSGWICYGVSFNNAANSGKVYKAGADVTTIVNAATLAANALPLTVGKALASIAGLAYFPTVLTTADHLAIANAVPNADTVYRRSPVPQLVAH